MRLDLRARKRGTASASIRIATSTASPTYQILLRFGGLARPHPAAADSTFFLTQRLADGIDQVLLFLLASFVLALVLGVILIWVSGVSRREISERQEEMRKQA